MDCFQAITREVKTSSLVPLLILLCPRTHTLNPVPQVQEEEEEASFVETCLLHSSVFLYLDPQVGSMYHNYLLDWFCVWCHYLPALGLQVRARLLKVQEFQGLGSRVEGTLGFSFRSPTSGVEDGRTVGVLGLQLLN